MSSASESAFPVLRPPPPVSERVRSMSGSVFSRLRSAIAALEGPRFPLHVGDTWRAPSSGAHLSDFCEADHPGLHRYCPPAGHPELLAALAEVRGWDPARTLVTAGATGGLHAALSALLDPGDEVVVLAPCWPLFPGIVRVTGGQPVFQPFYDRLDAAVAEHGSLEAATRALVEPALGPGVRALYVNSPNNPTGRVLPEAVLATLAELAQERGLWLLSDEVYDHFATARPHLPLAQLAPDHTITAWSFSKSYGIAGARCGALHLPSAALRAELRKTSMHAVYQAPTVAQLAGARLLRTGSAWLAESRRLYAEAGAEAAAALGLPAPEGGTFLFVDVGAALHPELPPDDALTDFLLRCLERGLILAPGSSCGPMYSSHVRLCFTSAPPEDVRQGVAVLRSLLDEGPRVPPARSPRPGVPRRS